MRVAIYVRSHIGKKKSTSYNAGAWFGAEMLRDVLLKAGHEVEYCTLLNVHNYDAVLVSMVSASDWWSFIEERQQWEGRPSIVVVGGSGVMNVRPFLWSFDVAIFGRGESLITPLLESHQKGARVENDSLCYSDEFSMDKEYRYCQAEKAYGAYKLSSGVVWSEEEVGCKHRCAFCCHSWARSPILKPSKSISGLSIKDLDLNDPDSFPKVLSNLGVDGCSDRLRTAIGNGLKSSDVKKFTESLVLAKTSGGTRLYGLIGLPTETIEDWKSLYKDLKSAHASAGLGDEKKKISLKLMPFRAMPCTPSAVWPVSQKDYQESHVTLSRWSRVKGYLFTGNKFEVVVDPSVDGLGAVILDMIVLRGTEEDAAIVKRISINQKFWKASDKKKVFALNKLLDVERFMRQYGWHELPTRYLKTYEDYEIDTDWNQ